MLEGIKEKWDKISIDDFFYSFFIIFLCIAKIFYNIVVWMIQLITRLFKRITDKTESEMNKKI